MRCRSDELRVGGWRLAGEDASGQCYACRSGSENWGQDAHILYSRHHSFLFFGEGRVDYLWILSAGVMGEEQLEGREAFSESVWNEMTHCV